MVVKKPKALVLMSGGLDSMLAAKLLIEQGIEVTALCFVSNFFNSINAEKAAKNLGIDLKIVNISSKQLELVKNPPSGYGKNLNPCIDCHSLMVSEAAKIAGKEKYNIIATGEVLGQRPFSQTRRALKQVEELAGIDILRPLSAKLLEETIYEKNGLVKRGLLKDIRGRSRGRQIELARKYKIKDYATPAGGCLLTDEKFSQRLLKMLEYWPECDINDVEVIKNGRVYWLKHNSGNPVLVVVGRNHEENQKLYSLRKPEDIFIELEEAMGPTTMIRIKDIPACRQGREFRIKKDKIKIKIPKILEVNKLIINNEKSEENILNIACLLTGYYSPRIRGRSAKFKIMI